MSLTKHSGHSLGEADFELDTHVGTILEQMPVGVIIAGVPSGELLFGNAQVERIFRHAYRPAQSVAQYARYRGYRADGTRMAPEEWPLARAVTGGEVVTGEEVAIERGDGTRGVISVSAAPIEDPTGEPIAAVVVFSDISERKGWEAERERLLDELRVAAAELEERVEKRTNQIRALASALAVAEQRERRRISQVLHDELQQNLYALQMRIAMLSSEADVQKNPALQEQLSALEELADVALGTTRALTSELSPPLLKGEGFVSALEWLANHMEERYVLAVELDIHDELRPSSPDLGELLFQMVRELLFNVVKHAGVEEARVTLRKQANACVVEVKDGGHGFDPAALQTEAGPGYGLRSMQDRLRLFDGRLEIQSRPGGGTTVQVTIPCAGAGESARK